MSDNSEWNAHDESDKTNKITLNKVLEIKRLEKIQPINNKSLSVGYQQYETYFASVVFYCCYLVVVLSNTLRPHGLQHTRLPCPSLSPGVCSYSCQLTQWYYLTILSSVACFSSCAQSFPASGSFPVSWLFASGDHSIGASASASVLPVNIQGWFPLGLTIQGTFKNLLQHHSLKASILRLSAFFMVQLSHPYMTTGKSIALTRRTFVSQVICLFFNMLSRFVIVFPP